MKHPFLLSLLLALFSVLAFAPDPTQNARTIRDAEFTEVGLAANLLEALIQEAKKNSPKSRGKHFYTAIPNTYQGMRFDMQNQIESFEEKGYLESLKLSVGGNGRILYNGPALTTTFLKGPEKGQVTSWMFVMDDQGNIYVHPEEKFRWHHTSFFGKGVLVDGIWKHRGIASAGMIKIIDGKIVAIDASSGHYQPQPREFVQVLAQLERMGADLSEVDVTLFDNPSKRKLRTLYTKPVAPERPATGGIIGFCLWLIGYRVAGTP